MEISFNAPPAQPTDTDAKLAAMEALASITRKCTKLTSLTLSDMGEHTLLGKSQLMFILAYATGLQKLWFNKCPSLTAEAISVISVACPNLQELAIAGTGLPTDAGLAELGKLTAIPKITIPRERLLTPAGQALAANFALATLEMNVAASSKRKRTTVDLT